MKKSLKPVQIFEDIGANFIKYVLNLVLSNLIEVIYDILFHHFNNHIPFFKYFSFIFVIFSIWNVCFVCYPLHFSTMNIIHTFT